MDIFDEKAANLDEFDAGRTDNARFVLTSHDAPCSNLELFFPSVLFKSGSQNSQNVHKFDFQ